jgi:orotate phosphoribosyltransferase
MTIPAEVTLVDDVITRGAQMMGAAQAIWAVRADVIVRGFAVIRTISRPEDFKSIASPCSGQIDVRRSGDCFRSP